MRLLLFGQGVSLLGDEVFDTALMLWLGLAAAAGVIVVAAVEWSLLFTAAMFAVSFAAVSRLPSAKACRRARRRWPSCARG